MATTEPSNAFPVYGNRTDTEMVGEIAVRMLKSSDSIVANVPQLSHRPVLRLRQAG